MNKCFDFSYSQNKFAIFNDSNFLHFPTILDSINWNNNKSNIHLARQDKFFIVSKEKIEKCKAFMNKNQPFSCKRSAKLWFKNLTLLRSLKLKVFSPSPRFLHFFYPFHLSIELHIQLLKWKRKTWRI